MSNNNLNSLYKEQSQHFWACHFSLIPSKHQKVLIALGELEAEIRRGEKKRGEESREYVAKKARVSLRTVGNVIKKYENEFFTHKSERRDNHYKHKPNEYYLHPYFLEFMALANLNNYLYRWEEVGPSVIESLEKNDYFLVEKTMRKWKLSTMNLPTVWMLDLPTIKSYSSELLLEKQRVGAYEQAFVHKEKQAEKKPVKWTNPILNRHGLDRNAQVFAMRYGREVEIVEAIKACEYQATRIKIPNPSAYFIGTLRNKIYEHRGVRL